MASEAETKVATQVASEAETEVASEAEAKVIYVAAEPDSNFNIKNIYYYRIRDF